MIFFYFLCKAAITIDVHVCFHMWCSLNVPFCNIIVNAGRVYNGKHNALVTYLAIIIISHLYTEINSAGAAPDAASTLVSPAMGHWRMCLYTISRIYFFRSLWNWTVWQRLCPRHFTVCDISCCSLVVATWIYFGHFCMTNCFSFSPSFVPHHSKSWCRHCQHVYTRRWGPMHIVILTAVQSTQDGVASCFIFCTWRHSVSWTLSTQLLKSIVVYVACPQYITQYAEFHRRILFIEDKFFSVAVDINTKKRPQFSGYWLLRVECAAYRTKVIRYTQQQVK